MNELFADSYYWLALVHKRDPHHERVRAYEVKGSLVTSAPVQSEVMDALSGISLRPAAISFFAARTDKAWSLTDCISFTIMRDRDIRLALTGDRHFLQAGFEIAFP